MNTVIPSCEIRISYLHDGEPPYGNTASVYLDRSLIIQY